MTDRELLKLAAKASGILNASWSGNEAYFDGVITTWNPLNDDGDALRLAVKLGLGISFGSYAPLDVYSVYVSRMECGDTLSVGCIGSNDELVVVRRAIVRAAAEIGRGMA